MANLTLKQLREAQLANPPSVKEDSEPELGAYPDSFEPRLCPPSPGADCPPAERSLPLQASPSVQSVPAGGGYCRIFPPEFPSLLHVPQDWKAANWSCNSPWQHVEGAERHPDFESNLLAVEQSPEVCGMFPGE